jgi:hypothetical protein
MAIQVTLTYLKCQECGGDDGTIALRALGQEQGDNQFVMCESHARQVLEGLQDLLSVKDT